MRGGTRFFNQGIPLLNPYEIRPAGPSDVPKVHALLRALARYERIEEAMVCREADLHDALFGASPSLSAILAFEGEEAIGLATFYLAFSSFRGRKFLYLEDIFVVEAARGLGAGRLLMSHTARFAQAAGCVGMRWLVLDWNTPAQGFYASLGAVRDAQWQPCHLMDDALERLAAEGGEEPTTRLSKQ